MRNIRLFLMITLVLSFTACNRKPRITRMDTMTSGNASILCEDCFSPLIQEEISVFQGLNPEAHVTPIYTDEITAMNLFMKDSIRLVVAARDLTTKEFNYLKSKELVPRSKKIAVDGIALIINKTNKDSIIGIPTFKKILNGEITNWKEIDPRSSLGKIRIVFDNPNSSTVRYVEDSICGGKAITGNVKALRSNREVIDFVSNTSNTIGIIGVGWVSNKKDTTNLSFIDDIRVMSVSPYEDARVDNSYKPFAAYLALREYPMVRDIYMITSDVAGGLPAGVLHFVAGDRGQRIVLKCGLVPANRPMRLVSVKSKF